MRKFVFTDVNRSKMEKLKRVWIIEFVLMKLYVLKIFNKSFVIKFSSLF